MLILDVDGVLTDGSIILDPSGQEYMIFNVQDGFGIKMLQNCGLKIGIITGRTSEVVKRRAHDLGIDALFQGYANKIDAYAQIKATYELNDEDIAYIGDDLYDLPIIEQAGFSAAVANARNEVQTKANYVTECSGGRGAVREVSDLILKAQDKWNEVLERMIIHVK